MEVLDSLFDQKAKLKLGKGKQTPNNVVDTSFKARCECSRRVLHPNTYSLSNVAIALPSQSIVVDQDHEAPSTKRRLTFDTLISHTKHYNAGARRGRHILVSYNIGILRGL